MKKSIFMLGAALVAFASCSESSVEEVANYNAIRFTNPYTENVTKATDDIAQNGLESTVAYYVFGSYGTAAPYTEVFNNTKVVAGTPAVEAVWTPNSYKFAAYADGKTGTALHNVAFAPATKTLTITDYTATSNDLVAAVVADDIDGTNRNAAVPLTFNHLLSKVKFTFKLTDADYKAEVSNVTLKSVVANGSATINSTGVTWDLLSSNRNYIFADNISNIVGGTAGVVTNEFYIIPQQLSSAAVSFDLEITDANGYVIETRPNVAGTVTANLLPGLAYNFIGSISSSNNNKITFTATVAPWNETGSGTFTF